MPYYLISILLIFTLLQFYFYMSPNHHQDTQWIPFQNYISFRNINLFTLHGLQGSLKVGFPDLLISFLWDRFVFPPTFVQKIEFKDSDKSVQIYGLWRSESAGPKLSLYEFSPVWSESSHAHWVKGLISQEFRYRYSNPGFKAGLLGMIWYNFKKVFKAK